MKKSIYIIDLIGSFAGMDYYDTSLAKQISSDSCKVQILSNFSLTETAPFFYDIFGKSKLYTLYVMIWIYIKLFFHIFWHRKVVYIYMSYGEVYDFLFFTLNILNKKFFIDIHEVYSSRYYQNAVMQKIFRHFYRHIITKVIYHSHKTKETLKEFGYSGRMLFVPHFKYEIDTNFNVAQLGEDVKRVFRSDKIKMLFFGNLRKVKGIDIVINFINRYNVSDKLELVIAGRNVEKIDFSSIKNKCHIIDRHINDDELKYLYEKTDYILLPYRDSSQSGVLEMGFAFRTPLLMSEIKTLAT